MTTSPNAPEFNRSEPGPEPTKRPVRWGDRVKPTHDLVDPPATGAPSANGTSPERAARALFIVITVQNPYGHVSTSSHDVIVPVGTRHHDLLAQVLREGIPEDLRGAALLRSRGGGHMKTGIRRDWWTIGGVGVVAAAAVIASFTAQAGLGRLAGWDAALALPGGIEISLSWLLPLCVDAYGAVATRITVNAKYSAETRRHALIHAVGAVVVSIIANAIYHALEAKVLHLGTSRWVLVVAVSMVPPVALGALAHLMALCARDDTHSQPEPAPVSVPSPPVATPASRSAAPAGKSAAKRPRPSRKAPAPDVEELVPLGRSIAADHQARDIALTRDRLREAIRQSGQSMSTDRAGALLARLRSDPPAPPAGVGSTADATECGPHLSPVDSKADRTADQSADRSAA